MAKKRKGPTPRRLKSPCIHCKKVERKPGSVWCPSCIQGAQAGIERANREAWADRDPTLPEPFTGLRWWNRKVYRDADKDAYLAALIEELESDGD